MSEAKREPAYWVVKRGDEYWARCTLNPGGASHKLAKRGWGERIDAITMTYAGALRYVAELGGRAVPVYVTTRKVKRGRSFAWAWSKAGEGSFVRRKSWTPGYAFALVDGRLTHSKYPETGVSLGSHDRAATDWELA